MSNETGKMVRTNKTGEYIKKFNASLTGQCNYQERVERSNGNADYMPLKAKSVHPDRKNLFYTPQNDKLESYGQFPRPKTLPYFNQEKFLSLRPLKKKMVEQQQHQI